MVSNDRTDSTGSSLLSQTQIILAEDIIKDMAGAEDYSNRALKCCFNIFAMCCNRRPISLLNIYKAILQNKMASESRGPGSINSTTNIDEEIE